MNFRKLTHLLALLETGSFRKAAEAVHLSQSALSRSIQSLEDDLGIPLVDRMHGDLVPTPQGALVLQQIRRIAFNTHELLETIKRINGVEEGEVRVGIGPFPASTALDRVLKEMIVEYPRLKIHIERSNPELLLELLNDNKLDLVVGDSRYVSDTSHIHIIDLPSQSVGFATSCDHPLLKLGKETLALSDLEPWVVGAPSIPADLVDEIRSHGLPGFPSIVCDDMRLLITLASETELIAIVPDKLISRIEHQRIVRRLAVDMPFDISAHPRIMIARGKTIGPATDTLIRSFARQFDLDVSRHGPYMELVQEGAVLVKRHHRLAPDPR